MNDPNNFGANLKVLKKERQMTMTEFSNHLRIPKSTLQSVMENGHTTLDTACRISDALNIPLSVLTNGPLPLEEAQILQSILLCARWYRELEQEERKMAAHSFSVLLEVLQK